MQLSPSAHTDTFCRDNLPPPEQWPEFTFSLPGPRYPDRVNCATELLDTTLGRHGADRPCLLSPSGDWTYGEVLQAVTPRPAICAASSSGAAFSSSRVDAPARSGNTSSPPSP